MRLIFPLQCLFFFVGVSHAQVAVNSSGSAPHSSAMLDVSSTNRGLLIPSISLSNIASALPVISPANGLLIWNTNSSVTGGNGLGFYYWDGAKWQSLLSDNTGWRLQGNSGTNPSLHFIGTTDNQPLLFKVNNFHAGKIDPPMNNLFLGTGAGISISGVSAKRNTFVGDSAGYNNSTISDNSFFGYRAGHETTVGFGNSFFGSQAGSKLVSGNYNSFFGHNAGRDNTSTGNSFFGENAGLQNSGSNNSIFGRSAGSSNLNGSQNSFFGSSSADFGATGSNNSFFGYLSGGLNQGSSNSFFGQRSGLGNQGGNNNSFFGSYAGRSNSDGNFNLYLGDSAGYKSAGSFNTLLGSRTTTGSATATSAVSNSTAIGYLAQVDVDNSMVLGAINGVNGATTDINVGIGTTTPGYKLHIVNNNTNDGGWVDGIVIENTATTGEAGLSFRNTTMPANRQWTAGLNQNPHLAFSYGTSFSGGNTKMLIDTFGNVGVGTITPAAKLEVNGTAIIGVNGTVLSGIIKATVAADIDGPGGLVGGQSFTFTVTVANAQPGATVFVSPEFALLAGEVFAYARVSAPNTVEIKTTNAGSLSANYASQNLYITVIQ